MKQKCHLGAIVSVRMIRICVRVPTSVPIAVMRTGCVAFSLACFALFLVSPLQAVIFYSTGDPSFNTTEPTGSLANSGWQWVGQWGSFQGTPIGSHHFITARHVGGAVGEPFVLNGVTYTTTAFSDDPSSDLRIWQVQEAFPSWAPLYRANNEVGRRLVVFGRGLTRGAEVRDATTHTLRGWQWGASDGKMRWGQNAVVAVVNGGAAWGPLLYAVFNPAGGPSVAHLAQGDSSGPIFIHDGTGWKLAGIAASVDSAFNTTDQGPGFNAAIFDGRGLYFGSSGHWKLATGSQPIASGFQAMRISVHAAWIDGVLSSAPVAAAPALPQPVAADRSQAAAKATGWRPPARYQYALTIAALGNTRVQYQLGLALLQESDEAAQAEGAKWVRVAAAGGYQDAVALLATLKNGPLRPSRDRDNLRKEHCLPQPARAGNDPTGSQTAMSTGG